ncbi:MAG: DUF4136 domain-containing protein [Alteripontixanthobacter sp.]
MKSIRILAAFAGAAALSACATTPRAGPAEVVSFVAANPSQALGQGTIFIESAPGMDSNSLLLAPYKAAVARALVARGYTESSGAGAAQVAQVRLESVIDAERAPRRGPVSVGVGGGTGSYGSGVGVGLGINLGGDSGPEEIVDTQLGVIIRDRATGETLWEGRAAFEADVRSSLANSSAHAEPLADALFAAFPGATSEPVIVELAE